MDHSNTPVTAAVICDLLGRKVMAAELGVGLTAVSNASVEGRFPAKWYVAVRKMCEAAGIDCPESLFNFVLPSTSSSEDAA